MASDDWYRSDAWEETAQEEFRAKLERARTQRDFYLRIKAGAIAQSHPDAALELYEELLGEADGDTASIHYAMALIHWREGDVEALFEYLDLALGSEGNGLGAAGVMENAFVSGLLGRTERYARAMRLFEPWDQAALKQLGRPFVRSFAGAFGSAIILDHLGRTEEAREAALTALEWTQIEEGPIPGHPQLGLPPQVPDDWTDRMHAIAAKS